MGLYRCFKCGHVFEIDIRTEKIRCPRCNSKILVKMRPPVVKHVKAR